VQVTAQQASEVQPPQVMPATITLSSGADPPPPLATVSAQAAAVAQAQSGISSGPPPNLSLGGPSDMQMAQELGLLPTSPPSNGQQNAGMGLVSSTAISAPQGGQLGGTAPGQAVLPPMLHHAPAPQVQAQQAAAVSMVQQAQQAAAVGPLVQTQPAPAALAVQPQLLSAGPGLQVVGSQQQPVAAPALVGGAAMMSMPHASLSGPQVGMLLRCLLHVAWRQLGHTTDPPGPLPALLLALASMPATFDT
jgi:hypothetical protein